MFVWSKIYFIGDIVVKLQKQLKVILRIDFYYKEMNLILILRVKRVIKGFQQRNEMIRFVQEDYFSMWGEIEENVF